MKTSSLEILENAELPPAQAHAILKVLEAEMTSVHATLATQTDLLSLKVELKADIQAVKAGLSNLRAEMHGIEGKLSRWVLTCILGQTAVFAGLGYFIVTHLAR